MPNQTVRKKRKRRYAAPIGGLFIVFAAVGIISIAVMSVRLTFSFLDNDREKQMFEDLIRPVVMFDPVPFDSPLDIEMESMLRYSMWANLTAEKRSSYEMDDNSELIVPASDLDVAAARLFGPEVELVHRAFGDNDIRYYYVEQDGVYNVPGAESQLLVYRPQVVEIARDGEYLNVFVGYVPPETAWTQSSGTKPEKYMCYVMQREGDSYLIARVKDVTQEEEERLQSEVGA